MTDPELAGPSPGDKVLVVSTDTDMAELLRIIFKRRRIHLTIVPTVVEAMKRLDETFDMVWLRSPLPDFHTALLRPPAREPELGSLQRNGRSSTGL
jgi:DNA-binding NtrC family response regulator